MNIKKFLYYSNYTEKGIWQKRIVIPNTRDDRAWISKVII